MRLIDADTFEVVITKIPDGMDTESYVAGMDFVLNKIDDAPTVEERKTGIWIVTSEFEDCRYAKCSQCKVTQVFYYNKPLTNYCPHCGAKMEKEGEREIKRNEKQYDF